MLRSKINKEAWSKLSDELKAEYKASGEDYILDTDDAGELRSALENAKRERDEHKTRNVELAKQVTELTKSNGDFSSIENSYKDKVAKLESKLETANADLTKVREDSTLGVKAKELAAKHFTVPSLIEPLLKGRMELDSKDHTTIRFKDKEGRPSALTEADILKEFVDNAEYKSIVIANRASGGAGNGSNPSGAGNPPFSPTNTDGSPKILGRMSPKELAEHMAAKRAAAGTDA